MSGFNLRTSIEKLAERAAKSKAFHAEDAAKAQFNAFLDSAKQEYTSHIDLTAIPSISMGYVEQTAFRTSLDLLLDATSFLTKENVALCPKFKILRAESQLAEDFLKVASLGRPVGLLFFDIDKFKLLNTKYSETFVDEHVLKPFMTFLADLVHERGYAYSVGGDEFITLLTNADASETEAFGNRLLAESSRRRYRGQDDEVQFTLSVGTCCSEPGGLSVDTIRQNANRAENSAKAQGGNRVIKF